VLPAAIDTAECQITPDIPLVEKDLGRRLPDILENFLSN
jgi:hypothetical protein